MKKQKGITLIALVITIIVLLILAGVALSAVIGDNGILTKAQDAKTTNYETTEKEKLQLAVQEALIASKGKRMNLNDLSEDLNDAGLTTQVSEDETLIVTAGGKEYTINSNGAIELVSGNSGSEGTEEPEIEDIVCDMCVGEGEIEGFECPECGSKYTCSEAETMWNVELRCSSCFDYEILKKGTREEVEAVKEDIEKQEPSVCTDCYENYNMNITLDLNIYHNDNCCRQDGPGPNLVESTFRCPKCGGSGGTLCELCKGDEEIKQYYCSSCDSTTLSVIKLYDYRCCMCESGWTGITLDKMNELGEVRCEECETTYGIFDEYERYFCNKCLKVIDEWDYEYISCPNCDY